ncbi:MAG: Bacterial type II secretion system protein F domain protein [Elusimicrobia bacterium ADurb.Bin231]|nr:MAG: Bacterial type II secretion system protein F domain protein [Elusimicrobia bacterium ADurb.Bin231]
MLLLVITLCVFIFISFIVYAVFAYLKETKLKKRLKGKFADASSVEMAEQKGPMKTMFTFASTIGNFLERMRIPVLAQLADSAKLNLSILGEPYINIKPYTFIGLQLLASIASVVFLMALFSVYNPVGLVIFAVLGFFFPTLWIKEKVKAKHKAIFKQLPYVLDLLTLMVEAGLDFGAALNKILESEKGDLITEFSITQQEMKLGKSRESALIAMSDRVNYLQLSTVLNALVLAFKTGGSIAPTLRILSEQFRVERSQLAEKMAGQAPLKLMGPLILFIFPTIFIILFGPIVLSFIGGRYW